jgi:hypothetical protein
VMRAGSHFKSLSNMAADYLILGSAVELIGSSRPTLQCGQAVICGSTGVSSLKAARRRLLPQRGHLIRFIPTFIKMKMNKPAAPAMYQLLICSFANVA